MAMKSFRKLLCIGVVLGAPSVIGVRSAGAETLTDALAKAYERNPTILSARANLRGVDESVSQALANWRPTVVLSGDAGVSSIQADLPSGNQHRDPVNFGVDIDQPLFRGGRTLAETSEAENNIRAARAGLLDTEHSILMEAATAYVDVFREESILKLNINNEQVLRRQFEAAQDRLKVGEITRTDVFQAEARLAGAKADRIGAEGNLESSRATYRNVVGSAPIDLTAPAAPAALLPDNKENAVRLAVTQNPSVLAALYDVDAGKDGVDRVWGELLPEVSLNASADRDFDGSGPDTTRNTVAAKIVVRMPLYQAGDVYSRVREAKQTVSERRFDVDQVRRDALEDATSAWESLISARARVRSFKSQINASRIALEGVERENAVGSRTVLDVLDAEQELLDSRVNLVRAQRDEIVAVFKVLEAAGKLTAKNLDLPVTLYDEKAHYNEVRGLWFGGRSSGDTHDAQDEGR